MFPLAVKDVNMNEYTTPAIEGLNLTWRNVSPVPSTPTVHLQNNKLADAIQVNVVHISEEKLPSTFKPTHLSFRIETPFNFALSPQTFIFHLLIIKYIKWMEDEINVFRNC
jgi:hypothetical protein